MSGVFSFNLFRERGCTPCAVKAAVPIMKRRGLRGHAFPVLLSYEHPAKCGRFSLFAQLCQCTPVAAIHAKGDHDSHRRQPCHKQIGAEVGAAGIIQRTCDGAAEGGKNHVGIDEGEIQREMLLPIVVADKSGVDRRNAAV